MKRLLLAMLIASLLLAIPALTAQQAAKSAAGGAAQAAKAPAGKSAAKPDAKQTAKGAAAKTASGLSINLPAVIKSAEAINQAQLRDYLTFISSDEMEGRLAPSRALDLTAKFLAMEAARMGLKPAGDDGGFIQSFTVSKQKVVPEGTQVEMAGRAFAYGKDFIATAGGAANAPMVFAGEGSASKSSNIDPYAEMDPKGKIVILTQNVVAGGQRGGGGGGAGAGGARAGAAGAPQRPADYIDGVTYARQKGAVGIIRLNPLLTQVNPDTIDRARQSAEQGGGFQVDKLRAATPDPLPTIAANMALAQAIFQGEKVDVNTIMMSFPNGTAVKPFELSAGKKIGITVKTATETVPTENVVAIVEGSDPVLKNEYVSLGAHFDHLGVRAPRPAGGGPGGPGGPPRATANAPASGPVDMIYNGADDNGTGTVALLAIADALTKAPQRPKRSVLLVWHTGEEEGLWGSGYYTKFPTVPIDKVVANITMDMIGRSKPPGDENPRDRDLSGPNELFLFGPKIMDSGFDKLIEAVNSQYLKLDLNYKFDDLADPNRFFFRSDHLNYARKGIPVVAIGTGTHADYHQPSDEVSKIDFPKYEKIMRTMYVVVWELGEMKNHLTVGKPVPEQAPRRAPAQ